MHAYETTKQHYVDFGLLVSYWATDEQRKRAEQKERAVREFLLSQSDIVRLTAAPRTFFPVLNWKQFSLFRRIGDEHDPKFLEVLDSFKSEFIEKVVNNERYHVEQFRNSRFEHYVYHLSPRLKELFNTYRLFWYPSEHTSFYTFEDPSFYQGGGLLGHVVSHESQAFLNLTPTEKALLEKQGVDFDPTVEDMRREHEISKAARRKK